MFLPRGSSILDALFEDILCFFDELAMQINRVRGDSAFSIVFSENKVRSLFVVSFRRSPVLLSLLRKRMRRCTVTASICLVCLMSSGSVNLPRFVGTLTLSKQNDLFPASCRARSRRRSYSFSAACDWLWLNAGARR